MYKSQENNVIVGNSKVVKHSGTQHINISGIADDRVEFVDDPLTPAFNGAPAGDIAVLQNK